MDRFWTFDLDDPEEARRPGLRPGPGLLQLDSNQQPFGLRQVFGVSRRWASLPAFFPEANVVSRRWYSLIGVIGGPFLDLRSLVARLAVELRSFLAALTWLALLGAAAGGLHSTVGRHRR